MIKKLVLAMFASAIICAVSCKKESINPTTPTIKNQYMKSGGGDKRPSGTYD